MSIFSNLTSVVVPPWARWVAIVALAGAAYGTGRLQEARHDGNARAAAATEQAAKVVTLVKTEVQTVTKVETVYRDRIQKIYVQEKQNADAIPALVPPEVDLAFAVPAGFVRLAAASWAGAATGPAERSDREPSGVPFSELASIEVHNAASCFAWREQALGWRAFYAEQQTTINGQAPAWYHPEADDAGTERNRSAAH